MQNENQDSSSQLPEGSTPVVQPSSSPHAGSNKHEGLKSVLTTILLLLMAPILALSITAFVFQSYEVDGPSMENTLQSHDRLIVWKAGKTWSRITDSQYIPPRGTVIVFTKRGLYDFNSDREKQLIKRIIGVPGDKVVVRDGKITVYNTENPNGFDPDQTLGYGSGILGETEGNSEFTVGENEIFVVGDHRNNSLDSRSFGTVPAKDIVGTLSARILPLSTAKKF